MKRDSSSVVAASQRSTLLVGGPAFLSRLRKDILEAQESVCVQTLSFEGDAAGLGLADAMIASPARSKRIVADTATKYVVSDKVLLMPWASSDVELQEEVKSSHAMFANLERNGVPIRFSWPLVGPRYHRLIVRNHKKFVAIDDRVVYFGGINFSDHNFEWHDFMIRLESPGLAEFLRRDFDHTWEGRDQDLATVIDGFEVVLGDGRGNLGMRKAVARVLNRATDRIILQCPYVSEPFWRLLGAAHRRGVHVTVVMPENHNRSIMKWGTLGAARKHGFEFRLLPGPMTHAKVMRVDDTVILGSANFDFNSFTHQPEILLIGDQPDLVRQLNETVLDPDLARSVSVNPKTEKIWKQRVAAVGMVLSELGLFLARETKPSPAAPDPHGEPADANQP